MQKICASFMQAHYRAFTLIELLIVIALVAVLAAMTAPSFAAWRLRDQVDMQARLFAAMLTYARSEAMRRGMRVTLCRIDAAQRCLVANNAYNADAAVWAVLADAGGSHSVLRMQSYSTSVSMQGNTAAIAFTPPAGQVIGGFRHLEFTPRVMADKATAWRRCIRIAAGGRVRLTQGGCGGKQ